MFSTEWNKALKGVRFRLTLVYSTLFGLFICVFAFITSGQYLETARSDFDAALLNYAIDLSTQVHYDQSALKVDVTPPQREFKKQFPFRLKNTNYVIRSIDGKILFKSQENLPVGEIPYKSDLALKENYTHRLITILDQKKNYYRAINLKITDDEDTPMILQVVTSSSMLQEQEDRLFIVNILTIPLLILISSAASFLFAGDALVPIKNLTDTANRIAASNLSLRVPEIDTGDEIAELSKTFNTLLERLEKSFKAQEQFVANASHQLNTPLSIIKGELQVLESKMRSPEEVAKFHNSLREELDRLIALVKNMLLLSRVESGEENFIFNEVRVDELLLGVTARLRPKKREKRITLKFNLSPDLEFEDLIVSGEKQLLDCLFENLLENAIKYSPEDTSLKLDIEGSKDHLDVMIQDEGPGISDDDLKNVLTNRFKRGSKMMIPGTGLGLSLAYQIAEYHHATLTYKKIEPRGSRFTIRFPKQIST